MFGNGRADKSSQRRLVGRGRQHQRGHHAEGWPSKSPCERGAARIPRIWTRAAARGRQRIPRPWLQPLESPWIGSCRRLSCWAHSSCSDMLTLLKLQQGTHASTRARMPTHPTLLLLVDPGAHRATESSTLRGLSGLPRLPSSLDIFTPSRHTIGGFTSIYSKTSFYSTTVVCHLDRKQGAGRDRGPVRARRFPRLPFGNHFGGPPGPRKCAAAMVCRHSPKEDCRLDLVGE